MRKKKRKRVIYQRSLTIHSYWKGYQRNNEEQVKNCMKSSGKIFTKEELDQNEDRIELIKLGINTYKAYLGYADTKS